MAQRRIYFDHNATTPLHPEVKLSLAAAFEIFGNPSSMHEFGRDARTLIEGYRDDVAAFIALRLRKLFLSAAGRKPTILF